MTVVLMPIPKQQYFGAAGIPLVLGKVYTYAAGTSTPKQTFTDAAGTIPQANPIVLNARGEPNSAIYWSGNYKVVVQDALGNIIYTVDNYNTDPFGVASFFASLASAIGSTLIGFLQAGVGAVLITVQAALRDYLSAKHFGAVGDGVADDTAALQAAITACIASKKRLFIPAGTYNVTKVLAFGSQYCLKINGPICIYGDGQAATIVRTTKIGGALPDGSGVGYAGAFGIVTSQATPEVSFRDLTIEGGNTSSNRTLNPFNPLHKGIFCDLNAFPIPNYHLEFVAIQNFEGEGAYAPNGNITRAVFSRVNFANCGGSMGNTAGNTTYFGCTFTNGTNNGVEMSLDPNTGALTIDNCTFFNATQNAGANISCQGPSTTDASKRTGTNLIVRNTTFEYTQAWLTSTGAAPYRVSTVSFTGIGTVTIENNVFTNATVGIAFGHGIMLIRSFNDGIDFSNNILKVNDSFFNTTISHGNMGTTIGLQLRDNTTLSEYPLAVACDLYQTGGNITSEKFSTRNNLVQLKTAIPFTVALTTVDFIVLPPYKTYTVKITLNVVNSVASVIDFALGATHLSDLINEVLPVGHYTRYVTATVAAPASYNLMQQFRIRCSGDVANSFSVSFVDV